MVYCVKCGAENTGSAESCVSCGAKLNVTRERRHYRRVESECFGIPRGGTVASLVFGLIILIWGVIWLLQQAQIIAETVSIWPFAVMILGMLIIVGAIYGLRRRY